MPVTFTLASNGHARSLLEKPSIPSKSSLVVALLSDGQSNRQPVLR
jgi:hypothetical protein